MDYRCLLSIPVLIAVACAANVLITGVTTSDSIAAADHQFTCPNVGHLPLVHYGWQRHDGVCDCCDGSDEPAGRCPNTCHAAHQRHMQDVEQRRQQHEAGQSKRIKLLLNQLASPDGPPSSPPDCRYNRWLLSLVRPHTVTVTRYIDRQEDRPMHKDAHPIWSLLPKCSTAVFGKYQYEVCPFLRVTQVDLRTGQRVSLGSYVALESNSMLFENGQSCWRGPNRQTRVELQCADTEEVVSVEEPEQCSYLVLFKTCAVC